MIALNKVNSYRLNCLAFIFFVLSNALTAQVQVSEEPRHRLVFQNEYIRLLDVRLQPGDTSMFHIHSTPSVFLILSTATTGWQIKGEDWKTELSPIGKAWYRSFSPDTLVHRVANFDSVPFHVNDIEILTPYNKGHFKKLAPLPFTVLLENEKVITYQLMNLSNKKQIIQGRGPIVAELVQGDGIIYEDQITKQRKEIKAGGFLYIEPGTSFYFTATGKSDMNLVLFEFK